MSIFFILSGLLLKLLIFLVHENLPLGLLKLWLRGVPIWSSVKIEPLFNRRHTAEHLLVAYNYTQSHSCKQLPLTAFTHQGSPPSYSTIMTRLTDLEHVGASVTVNARLSKGESSPDNSENVRSLAAWGISKFKSIHLKQQIRFYRITFMIIIKRMHEIKVQSTEYYKSIVK